MYSNLFMNNKLVSVLPVCFVSVWTLGYKCFLCGKLFFFPEKINTFEGGSEFKLIEMPMKMLSEVSICDGISILRVSFGGKIRFCGIFHEKIGSSSNFYISSSERSC